MISGYKNEFDFINYLNNKKFEELNILTQEFILKLYPKIKNKDIIKAYKYGKFAKTDVVISVRNKKRGLSIKCGFKNSVHLEPISKFLKFLKSNGVNNDTIELFLKYIYSDGTINNTGSIRISNSEYNDSHQDDIKKINEIFYLLRSKLIKRFLIVSDIKYRVKPDIFIHGTINDFLWVSRDEVIEYLENTNIDTTSVHVSKLYVQNWNKNIIRNPKYEHCRDYIQVKWFSMFDDIIEIMSKR